MTHTQRLLRKSMTSNAGARIRVILRGLALGTVCLICAGVAFGAQAGSGEVQMTMPPASQIFTFLFLMLGPIKIIGPFAKLTQAADVGLARRLALRATGFSAFALLLAAFLGESLLKRYGIPLHVLALAGGIILFLVALQGILQQFTPPAPSASGATPPTLAMAISPLAFPTIVTPYGTAALIIFLALSPTRQEQWIVGLILLGIMLLDLVAMLAARHILRFLGVFLQILGAVLGIIQVSLGLEIALGALKLLWS